MCTLHKPKNTYIHTYRDNKPIRLADDKNPILRFYGKTNEVSFSFQVYCLCVDFMRHNVKWFSIVCMTVCCYFLFSVSSFFFFFQSRSEICDWIPFVKKKKSMHRKFDIKKAKENFVRQISLSRLCIIATMWCHFSYNFFFSSVCSVNSISK